MFSKFKAWFDLDLGAKSKFADASKPATRKQIDQMGKAPPAFTELLPFAAYDQENQAFILQDGVSCAALIELIPIPTEGRDDDYMRTQQAAMMNALNNAFDEEDDAPWIVQFFVNDDMSFTGWLDGFEQYIDPEIRQSEFTQHYLGELRRHANSLCNPNGMFIDTQLSNQPYKGQIRRVRCVIYRKYHKKFKFEQMRLTPMELLQKATNRFEMNFKQTGIQTRRMTGKDLYQWLLPFFNMNTAGINNPDELLARHPYPDFGKVFGLDLAETLFLAEPRSDREQGFWYFQGVPYVALTMQNLNIVPTAGHLTAERGFKGGQGNDQFFALFDKLPEGTMLSISITIKPQDTIKYQLSKIIAACGGGASEAEATEADCQTALAEMTAGEKMYPMMAVAYLRAHDDATLYDHIDQTDAILSNAGLSLIKGTHDQIALDTFMRGLPMGFDAKRDEKLNRRSRLIFASQIAALLPVYGRSRGSGKHGMTFFNRGGEPISVDPILDKEDGKGAQDRKKNAHLGIFGPTGAGKSATSLHLLSQTMAVYRPRLVIVDAGNSFKLFGAHCERLGLSVNFVELSPDSDVSLPPFADAYKMLDKIDAQSFKNISKLIDADDPTLTDDSDDKDEQRDILGEMEIVARIMITGGDDKEEAMMTRADRSVIRRAILDAARAARAANEPILLTEHVANQLIAISKDSDLPEERRKRAYDMGEAMSLYCTGLAGQFFNRQGSPWPDADVTIIELGITARQGYEELLSIAYLGAMNHVNAIAEAKQYERRRTIMFTDEAHIPFMNPLLSPYAVKITKMWRKLGTWFWFATQNFADLPGAAEKILKMIEWWILLTMDQAEADEVTRFKKLTPEKINMILATRKESGKYTEGVIFSAETEILFRSVPPALVLALGMTEKGEKADRADIMRAMNCSEIEAVYEITKRIENVRNARMPNKTDLKKSA